MTDQMPGSLPRQDPTSLHEFHVESLSRIFPFITGAKWEGGGHKYNLKSRVVRMPRIAKPCFLSSASIPKIVTGYHDKLKGG